MNRYGRNKNKGFTLAELLIVVAITIILASVGFIAIFQYQQNLKFTEMENDAREVFLAAQNSLTSMKENGVELQKNEQKMEDKLGKDNAPSDFDEAFNNAGLPGSASDYWKNNQSHFKYISHKAGESVAKGSLLDQILDFGSVDETIRTDGSYIIEYDEDTYTVYGVFYSDSSQIEQEQYDLSSEYEYLNTNRSDKEKRKDFGKQYNLGRLTTVGYYGAATDNDSSFARNIKAPQITLYNSGKISYNWEEKDKATKFVSANVDDNDETFKNENQRYLKGNAAKITAKFGDTLALAVTNPNKDSVTDRLSRIVVTVSGQTSGASKDITYFFKSSSNSNGRKGWSAYGNDTYVLNLDDISNKNGHFTQIFKDFIPGENITVSAKFVTKSGKPTVSKTLHTNSLFDDDSKDDTAYIRSPRHLQNLEPQISNINNKQFDKIDTDKERAGIQPYTKINKAIVKEDFGWNDFGSDKSVYKWDKGVVGTEGEKDFLSIYNGEITSFDGNNKTISDLNAVDNDVKINNDTTHNDAGLFAYVSKDENLTISNLTLSNVNATVQRGSGSAGGLVGEAEGDLTIEKVNISASENIAISARYSSAGSEAGDPKGSAGGLIGYSGSDKVTLKDVKVASTDHNDGKSIVVYGPNKAGGVIGFLNTVDAEINHIEYDGGMRGLVKADDRDVGGFIGRLVVNGRARLEDSYSTTYVYTNGNKLARAGGFIGYLNQTSGKTEIARCFYGGRTKDDGTYDDTDAPTDDFSKLKKGSWNVVNNDKSSESDDHATAGGFIGSVGEGSAKSVTVSDSYTTGSVYVGNGYAGGFAGQAGTGDRRAEASLVLKNTYATGEIYGASDKSTKGIYIGRNIISDDSTDNYYLAGINASDVKVVGTRDSKTINGISSATSDNATGPFAVTDDQKVDAAPYANLGSKYPYKFVTQLENKISPLTQHVGDWPKPKAVENKEKLEVDNGNKLEVRITVPEGQDYITLAVTGKTSKKTQFAVLYIDHNSNTLKIKFEQSGRSDSDFFNYDLGSIPYDGPSQHGYLAKNTDGSETCVVWLDDITVSGGQFTNLMSDLYPGEDISIRAYKGKEQPSGTGSMIGSPIETNSIYAYAEDDNELHTALISNARHLENLSDEISNINSKNKNTGINVTNAVQNRDIIWKDSPDSFIDDIRQRNQNVNINDVKVYNSYNSSGSSGKYRTVQNDKLRSYDALNSQNQSHHIINNLDINSNNNGDTGIFGVVGNNDDKKFTVENVQLSNVTANGTNNSGIITSKVPENVTLSVLNTELNGNLISTASGNAAIITGLLETNGAVDLKNIKISADNAEFNSTGNNFAGMLVGHMSTQSKLTADNTSISNPTKVISSSGNSAGGLVGYVDSDSEITLNDLTMNGAGIDLKSTNNTGVLAGFVGRNSKITVTDMPVNESSITSNAMEGSGLLGYVSGGSEVKLNKVTYNGDSIVTNGTNESGILAAHIEENTTFSVENTSITEKNISVASTANGFAGGLIGYAGANASTIILKDSDIKATETFNVSSSLHAAGGLAGMINTDKSSAFTNVTISSPQVTIDGKEGVGGLIGSQKGTLTVDNCGIESTGTLTINEDGNQGAGGIAGVVENIYVENTKLSGNQILIDSSGASAGGLVGTVANNSTANITSCSITSAEGANSHITGRIGSGGVVGTNSGTVNISNTSAALSGIIGSENANNSGGVIGYSSGIARITADQGENYNSDSIIALTNAGGLIGQAGNEITISGKEALKPEDMIRVNTHNIHGKNSSAGIVGDTSGKTAISNVAVENDDLLIGNSDSDSKYSGGAVGHILNQDLSIDNVMVAGKNLRVYAGTRGQGASAGGLIGFMEGYRNLSISNSSASAYVYSVSGENYNYSYSGGIAGNLQVDGNSSVKDTYAGGHTAGGRYVDSIVIDENSPDYSVGHYNVIAANQYGLAGGLIGNVDGTLSVSNTYTTASVYGGYIVGGFVGKVNEYRNESVKVENSYSTGLVGGSDKALKGAFAGRADDGKLIGSDDSVSYYLSSVNGNLSAGNKWSPSVNGCVPTDYAGVRGTSGDEISTPDQDAADTASPYDAVSEENPEGLGNKYPYKLVSDLDSSLKDEDKTYIIQHHYGDWYWNDFEAEGQLAYIEYAGNAVNVYTYNPSAGTLDGQDTNLTADKADKIKSFYAVIVKDDVFSKEGIEPQNYVQSLKNIYHINASQIRNNKDINFTLENVANVSGYQVFRITNDDYKDLSIEILKNGQSFVNVNLNFAKAITSSGNANPLGSKENPYVLRTVKDYGNLKDNKDSYRGSYFIAKSDSYGYGSMDETLKSELVSVDPVKQEYVLGSEPTPVPTPTPTPTSTPTQNPDQPTQPPEEIPDTLTLNGSYQITELPTVDSQYQDNQIYYDSNNNKLIYCVKAYGTYEDKEEIIGLTYNGSGNVLNVDKNQVWNNATFDADSNKKKVIDRGRVIYYQGKFYLNYGNGQYHSLDEFVNTATNERVILN